MNDNRRGTGTWLALAFTLGIYFAFILTIAFAPHLFTRPLAEGMATTVGFPVGTAIIVACMIVAGIYTAVKNRADAEAKRGPRQ
jgi:uncharacterized membrane protein (DUF485 family)